MKTSITAMSLIVMTAATIYLWPQIGNTINTGGQVIPPVDVLTTPKHKIEVVFVLDTTGSMSGLIDTAKQKIWSIASSMASAQSAPEIEIGLVGYRDRGDAYLTKVIDLNEDLDSVYAALMDFEAAGGGDTPEDVNTALDHALNRISWSNDQDTYQVVFLVGDAPPHMDYSDGPRYPEILRVAKERGIIVNTIRCGDDTATQQQWQQIAALTQGRYFTVDQAGTAVAIATPFDIELAELSAELDATRVVYGDAVAKAKSELKEAATDKLHELASMATRARRAAFNAMESGVSNLYGKDDLVAAVESGSIDLDDVDRDVLPEEMKAMAPATRQAFVDEQIKKRQELNARIDNLVDKRADYIETEAEEVAEVENSFEYQLYDTIRDQAAKVGMTYDAEKPQL
jgi:Mg-chelatase subunit ChlD